MKFDRTKIDSLMGHTEVRFIESEKKEFAIVASPRGIRFEGPSPHVEDRATLNQIAACIGAAWNSHQDLKPKLLKPGEQ